jgi:signal peptidase I
MTPTLHPYGEIVLIDKWSVRRVSVQDGSCIGAERVEAARQRQKQFEIEHNNAKMKPSGKEDGKEKDDNDQDDDDDNDNDDDDDCPWHEARISVTQRYQMAQDTARWQFYRNVLWKQFTSPLSIGDVVVVQHPARRGTICKRVLGLPGDTVVFPRRYAASWMQQQQQQQQSFTWRRSASSSSTTLAVIPNGHVWLEGDNPANSSDSRYYGPIPLALIQGRVLFRVWPLRGQAWMHRGAPPIHADNVNNVGFTILPAGYEGQRIIKKS